MERENHINPELTGQAESAYSSDRGTNMPEGAEGTPINEGDLGRLQGPDITVEVRKVAEEVAAEQRRAEFEGNSDNTSVPSDKPEADVPPASGAGGAGDIPPGDRPTAEDGEPPFESDSHAGREENEEPEKETGENTSERKHSEGERTGNKRREGENESDSSHENKGDRQSAEFLNKFIKYIDNPEVQALLSSDNPNFYQVGVKNPSKEIHDFVKFIETIDPSSDELVTFASLVSRDSIKIPLAGNNNFFKINLSSSSRKLLFEWSVERLISIPDKSPESHYSIGGFRAQDILDRLKGLSITAFDEEKPEFKGFSEKIASTIETRMLFHELRRKLSSREEYAGFLIEGLKTHGIDFAQNEMVGVHQVIAQLERRYFHTVSKSKEWISLKDADLAESEARERINEMWKKGLLKVGDRPLTEWEKERAIRLGLTFYAGLQRKALAIGVGDLPGETSKRVGSRPTEYIFRTLYAVKSIGIRFHGQGEAQQDMISRIIERKKEQEKSSHAQTKSLLGASQETMIANQWGAPDLQSHGWRSQFLFLSGIKIKDRGNFLDVFNEATKKHNLSVDEATGRIHPLYGGGDKKNISAFEAEISNFVLGQNLYLSVLARQDFSTNLLTKIWQKRASLDPLAVATLRPEIISNLTNGQRQIWEGMVSHLDIAHGVRMQKELVRYGRDGHSGEAGSGLSENDLSSEAANWSDKVSEETKYQILNDEYLSKNLSESQKEILKTVIDSGYGEANYLATAVFPHTYMLDDAPFVAWADQSDGSGLGDENMYRGFGDQKTLQEAGWAPMNNLFQSPRLGQAGEVFDKSYAEGLSMIHDPASARKYLEPFILGWLDFASATEKSKWIGLFEKERGVPRSAIEKYFPKSYIAMDETDKATWLDLRAQNGTVTPDRKGLDKYKKKAKASRRYLIYHIIREWSQILPAAFIAQFLKMTGSEIKGGLEDSTK